MFNILSVAEQFAQTLAELGDLFLNQPFGTAINTLLQLDRFDGVLFIPKEWYLELINIFDFTIGELVFTTLIGLIIGFKLVRLFIPIK